MNKQVIDLGKILALIGGILSLVEIILEVLSLSIGFSPSRDVLGLGGLVGSIVDIALNLLIILIVLNKLKIQDFTVMGVLILVLALISGNLLSILGGILILVGVYLK